MRDLVILLTFVGFLTIGTMSPFVLALGYVWVDLFSPQTVTWSTLSTLPLAFIMGAASVAAYLLLDRRAAPRPAAAWILLVLITIWVTMTTTWAAVPVEGWIKWEVAFKVLIYCIFIPYVIRSRVQIEAFIHVYVFSMAAHILPWALKTLLTGGGYGLALGLVGPNVLWLSESSAVATIGIMVAPLLLTLRRHTVLLPQGLLRNVIYYGTALGGLFASIGTFARTAIVGLAVLGIAMLLRTKRKVAFLATTVVIGAALLAVTSDKWTARISTIQDFDTESSSLIRILVWRWTIDYVAVNPFGGGFRVWLTDRITFPNPDPTQPPIVQTGRAFHSMYFAILGEHGVPGIVMYAIFMIVLFTTLRNIIKRTAGIPTHEWAHDLAKALQITIAVMLACGNFIDVSFEPLVWYLFTMVICLNEYVRRSFIAPGVVALAKLRDLPGGPRHVPTRGSPVPGTAVARL